MNVEQFERLPEPALHAITQHILEGKITIEGLNVVKDNPNVAIQEFYGTSGVVDWFVFDATDPGVQGSYIHDFETGVDKVLFTDSANSKFEGPYNVRGFFSQEHYDLSDPAGISIVTIYAGSPPTADDFIFA